MVRITSQEPLIRPVKKNGFFIPMSGDPRLHEELEWFATNDDAVLGVVIRNRSEDHFAWVILTTDDSPAYRAIEGRGSLPSQQEATEALHSAMEAYYVARRTEAAIE